MTAIAPPLDADLVAGLERLQLAHFRAVAAETLQTATTQRWTPEALLRALITTEVTGRNAANLAARLKAAGFRSPRASTTSRSRPRRCRQRRSTTSRRWNGCEHARTSA